MVQAAAGIDVLARKTTVVPNLGDAEVSQNDPAAAEDEDVLSLDVSVEHAVCVHVVQA